MVDTSVQPTAKFSKTDLALTEETKTSVPVAITVGVGEDDTAPAGLTTLSNMIRFKTSPAGAAVFETCDGDSEKDVIALTLDGIIAATTPAGVMDTWELTNGAGNVGTATISIEACGDMTGFTDEMVTFSFDAMSLMGEPTGYGNVANGGDLVVTVRSEGEATPTVSFSTTAVPVDEGDTNTVAIIADGKLGPEVGSVMISVVGDAMISLAQGTTMLEADADDETMYAVDLEGSANTILTIMADEDSALHDGVTASATLKIESANGALIGERDSVTVTVTGKGVDDGTTDPDDGTTDPDDEETDPDDEETTTQAGDGDIGIKSVKVDAADSAGKVDEGTTTMVTVTLTEDWTAATAAKITLVIGVADGAGGDKGNAELEASTDGGPVDLLLGSTALAVNKDQDKVSIALLVNDDLDAVDEKFDITATLTGVEDVTDAGKLTGNFSGSIVDDETQTYEFEVKTDDDEIVEDDTFEVTLKAKPNRPAQEDVKIYLRAPKGYKAAPSEVDLNATDTLQTITVETPKNDKNRTDDVITLNAVTGSVASNKEVGTSDSITVLDIHQLPTDITGEANGADEDGKETDAVVTMVAEGGKAFLYVTVVNEDDDRISDVEDFLVTPTVSGSQVLDARIMPTNMKISDGEESGDETVVGPFTIEAVNDEDIGMEALTVSLDVTGGKDYGPGTSSGTFSINIEDGTELLVFVKDGAYAAIMAALGGAMAPGATVTIMTDDLFGTAEGYTASFGAAVEGDTISASASGESFTLTASEDMTGESKVTVTATARMMGSSFIPSQTVSNVAEIVFPVMVEAAEPVPALPLIGQLLLALFMMAGGARLYRRRQG